MLDAIEESETKISSSFLCGKLQACKRDSFTLVAIEERETDRSECSLGLVDSSCDWYRAQVLVVRSRKA